MSPCNGCLEGCLGHRRFEVADQDWPSHLYTVINALLKILLPIEVQVVGEVKSKVDLYLNFLPALQLKGCVEFLVGHFLFLLWSL